MYDRKAFKREAKQRMRQSVPHFMLVALVYYLLTWGISTAISWLTDIGLPGLGSGMVGIFLNILVWLFSIVMAVGLSNYALRLIRREPTGWNSLFAPFNYTGRAIGLPLMVALYTFLWALLMIAGYIVVAVILGFLMASGSAAAIIVGVVLLLAAYIALFVVLIMIVLRYAMASFVLVENPDVGVMESIRRSIRMMRGHKGKLFVLELSFIGWDLLVALISMIVVGIGFVVSNLMPIYQALISAGSFSTANDLTEFMALYDLLTARIAPWGLLAQVLTLPLNMWLLIYQQTAFARFYNYVSGYDYHRYLNTQQSPAEPVSDPTPIQPAQEPERPVPPVEHYYTPQPDLSEQIPAEPEVPTPETPTEPETPAGEPAEAPEEDPVPDEGDEASDEEEI